MKQFMFLVFFILGIGTTFAQCPDSVTCKNNTITFHYSQIHNVDSLDLTVNGTTTRVAVTRTPNSLTMNQGSFNCSDSFTSLQYYRNGNSVGTACNTGGQLPVTLLNFEGEYFNGSVFLNWVTASEYNADKFVIMYLKDNTEWVNIGEVNCTNTNYSVSYYFSHDNVSLKKGHLYQLRQWDYDRKYHKLATILVGGERDVNEPIKVEIFKLVENIDVKITVFKDYSYKKETITNYH